MCGLRRHVAVSIHAPDHLDAQSMVSHHCAHPGHLWLPRSLLPEWVVHCTWAGRNFRTSHRAAATTLRYQQRELWMQMERLVNTSRTAR